MEAYVDGLVIKELDNGNIVIRCVNGNIVEIAMDNLTDQETKEDIPNLTGKKIEVEGKAYFNNGQIFVLVNKITTGKLDKTKRYVL